MQNNMTTLSADPSLGLLPPRRLGVLLRDARCARGFSVGEVSATLGHRVTELQLLAHEEGVRLMDDDDVRIVASLYDLRLDALFPQRCHLQIDREEGLLMVGGLAEPIPSGRDQVLIRYLSLVYLLRGVKPGRFFVPRKTDLNVLSELFETSADGVRRDLEAVMSGAREEITGISRVLSRRLAAPGLGLLVALTSVGALLMVPTGPPHGRDLAGRDNRVGTAVVFERDADPQAITSPFESDDDPTDPRVIVGV